MQDLSKGFRPMRDEQWLVDGLNNLLSTLENYFGDLSLCNMIEIGSYTGESSKIFASKFDSVLCIDPFVDDYDLNDPACHFAPFDAVLNEFLRNTKEVPNITLMRDFSDNALKELLGKQTFDFVYIDGLHTYDQVKKDIENSIPLLSNRDGICLLGGHDYHFGWQGVVDAVNEKLGVPEYTFVDTSWIKILRK